MRVAIVGAGPTGLYLAIALARRGHGVSVVDRDTGPKADGTWERRGVMQFHHPHAFRQQVSGALITEMSDVWTNLLAAGAESVPIPGAPDGISALRCRRLTFERVLRDAALGQPGVSMVPGYADALLEKDGRAVGVSVDGHPLEAELVIDASGRAGRIGRGLRASAEVGDCGLAYVSQQHELHPGADLGPMNAAIGIALGYSGYLVTVFLHDNRTFSTLVARASDDKVLAGIRVPEAFAAVLRAVPALAEWTDASRSRPITPVMPGGRLYNSYLGQLDDDGRVAMPGLVFVGDSVCTTNPSAGRGIATSLAQAHHLLGLLDEHSDHESLALAFHDWCEGAIRPWFEDHVYIDQRVVRRWAGADVDLSERLPSDLVAAAAMHDQSLMPAVGPYLAMLALPQTLDAVQPRVRDMFTEGWRPPVPPGPTRDDLAALVSEAVAGE